LLTGNGLTERFNGTGGAITVSQAQQISQQPADEKKRCKKNGSGQLCGLIGKKVKIDSQALTGKKKALVLKYGESKDADNDNPQDTLYLFHEALPLHRIGD
jgi:flagellar hook assembly protein FlgD